LEEKVRDLDKDFDEQFDKEFLGALQEYKKNGGHVIKEIAFPMREQGRQILSAFKDDFLAKFPKFEVLSTEEMLYEKIPDTQWSFKGFIDLVLVVNDKVVLIDNKTCSWGWDTQKKADKMTVYQLVLYKHFYAKKHGLDPKDILTYFNLLKRTAKKNIVEPFEVTSGPKRISNALESLSEMLKCLDAEKHIKNRLNCSKCNFRNTIHCHQSF
jgi:ATP-dependent exoDNAse (exonuclease V) beta subunit